MRGTNYGTIPLICAETQFPQFSLQTGADSSCEEAKWSSAGHQQERAVCPQPVGAGVFGQI